MTTFVVTGAGGFLGWHLRVYFHARPEFKIVGVDRSVYGDPKRFTEILRSADAVVHLAGMNRGNEQEIERVNVDLTTRLIGACRQADLRPQIVLANSTHCERDTAYGRSKRRSAELLAGWASEVGAVFTNLVIPNVYGEGGRPFYNSVVSTFCHQLASGEKPAIIQDGRLELVHAQAVVRELDAAIQKRISGEVRMTGSSLSVSDLLETLQGFDRSYRGHLIPELTRESDLDLFNTYRSYLYPRHYPVTLPLHSDARGNLFEENSSPKTLWNSRWRGQFRSMSICPHSAPTTSRTWALGTLRPCSGRTKSTILNDRTPFGSQSNHEEDEGDDCRRHASRDYQTFARSGSP